jgi:hypothetical protein
MLILYLCKYFGVNSLIFNARELKDLPKIRVASTAAVYTCIHIIYYHENTYRSVGMHVMHTYVDSIFSDNHGRAKRYKFDYHSEVHA